jgi:hypothetical protein
VYLYVVETCSAGATSVVSSEFRMSSAWIASVDVDKLSGSRTRPGRLGRIEEVIVADEQCVAADLDSVRWWM